MCTEAVIKEILRLENLVFLFKLYISFLEEDLQKLKEEIDGKKKENE